MGRFIDDRVGTATCWRVEVESFVIILSTISSCSQDYMGNQWDLHVCCSKIFRYQLIVIHSQRRFLISRLIHSYLLFSSSHSNYTKQSIPHFQFLRLHAASAVMHVQDAVTLPHLSTHLNPISLFGIILSCTSSNIYCISCSKCYKNYIGETGRRLFAEHLYNWNHPHGLNKQFSFI